MKVEKEKALIYSCFEWGKHRYFVTWNQNEKGQPIGGHEIGPIDTDPEKLLNSLCDLLEED